MNNQLEFERYVTRLLNYNADQLEAMARKFEDAINVTPAPTGLEINELRLWQNRCIELSGRVAQAIGVPEAE